MAGRQLSNAHLLNGVYEMKRTILIMSLLFCCSIVWAKPPAPVSPWKPGVDGSGNKQITYDGNHDGTVAATIVDDGSGEVVVGSVLTVGGTNPASFDVDGDGTAEYILGDTAPAAADSTGTAGTIVFNAADNYIYFCIATDTWVRVEMATW